MRIVAGKFEGRQLTSPADKRVRPTAEHVRDALMRTLARDLEGARVLDLFAGTGALGLEAMSRGAKYADFVETRPASLHALKANIAALRVRERSRVFKKDAIPFAALLEPGAYDIAFVDPPYGSAMLDRVLDAWRITPFARVLVVEHEAGHNLPPGGKTHLFHETVVTVYRSRSRKRSVSVPVTNAEHTKAPASRGKTTAAEAGTGHGKRKRPPKAVREAERELRQAPRAAKGAAKKDASERPRRTGQRQDRMKPTGVGKKRTKTGSKPRVRE